MKQKMVIKVQMKGEKCRSKVLKIVAEAHGVTSMAIEGPEKDRVVVIGIGVDSVNLTKCLRKKMGHATIISVQQVKDEKEKPVFCASSVCPPYRPCPPPICYPVVYEEYPTNNCSIM